MKINKNTLKQIVKEEVAAAIAEKGNKGMLDQPTFKAKVAWIKRNKPEVEDPDAYVAATLRSIGELKEDVSTYMVSHMKNLLSDVMGDYRVQIYVDGKPVDIEEIYVSDESEEVVITLK